MADGTPQFTNPERWTATLVLLRLEEVQDWEHGRIPAGKLASIDAIKKIMERAVETKSWLKILPHEERMVLLLRTNGQSWRNIKLILGISEVRARRLMTESLIKIKDHLNSKRKQ